MERIGRITADRFLKLSVSIRSVRADPQSILQPSLDCETVIRISAQ